MELKVTDRKKLVHQFQSCCSQWVRAVTVIALRKAWPIRRAALQCMRTVAAENADIALSGLSVLQDLISVCCLLSFPSPLLPPLLLLTPSLPLLPFTSSLPFPIHSPVPLSSPFTSHSLSSSWSFSLLSSLSSLSHLLFPLPSPPFPSSLLSFALSPLVHSLSPSPLPLPPLPPFPPFLYLPFFQLPLLVLLYCM